MLKDKQELITESIGYHETSDPLNSLFSRRCGNGSRLRVAGGKRCERGLEPSEARLTGVPRALLPPDPCGESATRLRAALGGIKVTG